MAAARQGRQGMCLPPVLRVVSQVTDNVPSKQMNNVEAQTLRDVPLAHPACSVSFSMSVSLQRALFMIHMLETYESQGGRTASHRVSIREEL